MTLTIFLSRLTTLRAAGVVFARRLWQKMKRIAAILHEQLLFLIVLTPLVLGLIAGLSYGLTRRCWAALVVGFESGDHFVNGQPRDRLSIGGDNEHH